MSYYERNWFCKACADMHSRDIRMEFETKTIANHGAWKCRCGKIADNLMPGLAAVLDGQTDQALIIYRDFFNTWESFQITNASTHSQDKKLAAARELIEAWDRVKNYRNLISRSWIDESKNSALGGIGG